MGTVTSTTISPPQSSVINRPNVTQVGIIVWLGSEVMFFAGLFAIYFTLRTSRPSCGPIRLEAQHPVRRRQHGHPGARRRSPARPGCSPRSACSPTAPGGPLQFWKWGVVEWFYLTFVHGRDLRRRARSSSTGSSSASTPHSPATRTDRPSTSTTGFHALHVTGGLFAFLLVLGRVFAVKNFTHREAITAISVSYYWHFVDVVWIGLFARHLPPQIADRITTQPMTATPAPRRNPLRTSFSARLAPCSCSSACSRRAAATRSSPRRASAETAAQVDQLVDDGEKLFQANCASCHGLDAQGTDAGPTLHGVGAASVDFQVGPAACRRRFRARRPSRSRCSSPTSRSRRSRPMSPSLGPGPAIPDDRYLDGEGDVANGAELFRINCAMCHNVAGAGGALTEGKYAPALTGMKASTSTRRWSPARRTCRSSTT